MGVSSVMVPTDVPMAVEIKQATTNSTATANLGGMMDSMKYATLCAPLRPTTPTNAPAARKIRSIVMMLGSPRPRPMIVSFSLKETLRFCRQAVRIATRNAATMGTL